MRCQPNYSPSSVFLATPLIENINQHNSTRQQAGPCFPFECKFCQSVEWALTLSKNFYIAKVYLHHLPGLSLHVCLMRVTCVCVCVLTFLIRRHISLISTPSTSLASFHFNIILLLIRCHETDSVDSLPFFSFYFILFISLLSFSVVCLFICSFAVWSLSSKPVRNSIWFYFYFLILTFSTIVMWTVHRSGIYECAWKSEKISEWTKTKWKREEMKNKSDQNDEMRL